MIIISVFVKSPRDVDILSVSSSKITTPTLTAAKPEPDSLNLGGEEMSLTRSALMRHSALKKSSYPTISSSLSKDYHRSSLESPTSQLSSPSNMEDDLFITSADANSGIRKLMDQQDKIIKQMKVFQQQQHIINERMRKLSLLQEQISGKIRLHHNEMMEETMRKIQLMNSTFGALPGSICNVSTALDINGEDLEFLFN
jgi:hypothetical protein